MQRPKKQVRRFLFGKRWHRSHTASAPSLDKHMRYFCVSGALSGASLLRKNWCDVRLFVYNDRPDLIRLRGLNLRRGVRMVREAKNDDLDEILALYLHLHEKSVSEKSEWLKSVWSKNPP